MLTPEAERLWNLLREHQSLAGFVLIGGSALSLRIDHRLSEDLDFVHPGERLPTHRLSQVFASLDAAGIHWRRDDDEAARNRRS